MRILRMTCFTCRHLRLRQADRANVRWRRQWRYSQRARDDRQLDFSSCHHLSNPLKQWQRISRAKIPAYSQATMTLHRMRFSPPNIQSRSAAMSFCWRPVRKGFLLPPPHGKANRISHKHNTAGDQHGVALYIPTQPVQCISRNGRAQSLHDLTLYTARKALLLPVLITARGPVALTSADELLLRTHPVPKKLFTTSPLSLSELIVPTCLKYGSRL